MKFDTERRQVEVWLTLSNYYSFVTFRRNEFITANQQRSTKIRQNWPMTNDRWASFLDENTSFCFPTDCMILFPLNNHYIYNHYSSAVYVKNKWVHISTINCQRIIPNAFDHSITSWKNKQFTGKNNSSVRNIRHSLPTNFLLILLSCSITFLWCTDELK